MDETGSGTTADPIRLEPARDGRVTAVPAVPAVLAVLAPWVTERRWFPAKGTEGAVEHVAVAPLPDPLGEAEVTVHVLRAPGGAMLQVPLTVRPVDRDLPHEDGLVGRVGDVVVRDACHDPAFVRAWLAAARWDRLEDDAGPSAADGMRVLTGEQSNTSVLLPGARVPAILKVFRVLATGPSPDVDVPLALAHTGWTGVPRPFAWLAGAWPGASAPGHLGVLSELVAGAEDGFRLACAYAADGASFGDLAEDLGRTTAEMHVALRRALPLPEDPAPTDQVLRTLRDRAAAAVEAAPVLRDRAAAVEAVLAGVADVGALPPLQRVHGDYHLGQVLHSDRGWSVLDFEGEPMAAAEDRTRPDLALRDLAGMLRSVDYAAAVGEARSPAWAVEARARLVTGYTAAAAAAGGSAGTPSDALAVLLRALELDKALYEVVYEVRNRPSWVAIPLAGVDRLLGEGARGDAS